MLLLSLHLLASFLAARICDLIGIIQKIVIENGAFINKPDEYCLLFSQLQTGYGNSDVIRVKQVIL